MSLLTRYQDQGQRSPFGNLFFLGSLKEKSSQLPVLVHNCREQTHGMWLRRGIWVWRISQEELWVSCTSVHQGSEPAAVPRRPELAGDQSSVLPFHGLTEGGSHLLSSSSSSPAGLDWRMLLLLVPMETPSQDAEGRDASSPLCRCTPKPQLLALQTCCWQPRGTKHRGKLLPIPTWSTDTWRDRTGANSSQSQPEMYSFSKAVTPKSSVKSSSLLDATTTRQGPEEKLPKTRAEKSKYDPNVILLL